jgi:tRNA A37 threonylcarbamoyltransferase TsaD
VCLSVGLETARNLAIESGLPFIAVNHLEVRLSSFPSAAMMAHPPC